MPYKLSPFIHMKYQSPCSEKKIRKYFNTSSAKCFTQHAKRLCIVNILIENSTDCEDYLINANNQI